MNYRSIVIGAGAAGFTTAVYLARAGLNPLVIKGVNPSSHLTTTTDIEYFPGIVHGITGPELLDNMFKQAEQFGAQVKIGEVTKLDLSRKPFSIWLNTGGELTTDTLIIATGMKAKYLGIPGEKENLGRGVSTCAPCSGFSFCNKKVIVIGGGDSAMEVAIYLSYYASEVFIVNRSEQLRASQSLQNKVREIKKIKLTMNRVPKEILSDAGSVSGLKVINNESGQEEIIETDGVFVAIGNEPNTIFIKNQIPLDDQGYIRVKPGTTETEIPGVFACGDVQDRRYRQILNAIGSGCMAAIDCQRYLNP
jgi:thioredoxin reductase (NADPH)